MTLTPQEKDVLLPIMKEISQKPNADEAYLAQKAVEIKAVLAAAGLNTSVVETNKGKYQMRQGNSHNRFKGRPDNWVRRHGPGGRFVAGTVTGVYDYLLQVLMHKAYS